MKPLCNYFGYIFLSYCLIDKPSVVNNYQLSFKNAIENNNNNNNGNFEIEYQWKYINFTWLSPQAYGSSIRSQEYIPANVIISGIKYYKDRLYFCLPQIRTGVPVTMASISLDSGPRFNRLIEPFPSWELSSTHSRDCNVLKSVHSMEIDEKGIMWVIDGYRTNSNTNCPPKLVLLDLNNNGKTVLSYIFPKEVCLSQGGFLNDIVVDSTDGGYAYITDASNIDPGLVVYSRKQNKAWKLRDSTMFGEKSTTGFVVANQTVSAVVPIDGIALSPPHSQTGQKMLFYCPLSSYNFYGISTKLLKNFDLFESGDWRRSVKVIGKKQGVSDGLVIDNQGNLYYTLVNLYAIGKWNINQSFNESEILFSDKNAVWTDSLSIDSKGYLRLLTDNYQRFGFAQGQLEIPSEVQFRIFKGFIDAKSYMYT